MKEDALSSGWLRLDMPEAAQVVADPRSRRFLEPFLGRERTLSEVADELDVALSSTLYRVRRFMALGLLEVARVEPRHGRAVKRYRAVAEGFFVPFELTRAETFAAFRRGALTDVQRLLDESLRRAWVATSDSEHWGIYLFRDAEGKLNANLVPEPGQASSEAFFERLLEPHLPAVWDQHFRVNLSEEDAKALQRELSGLYRRYVEKGEQDGEGYIVRLAMAPMNPD